MKRTLRHFVRLALGMTLAAVLGMGVIGTRLAPPGRHDSISVAPKILLAEGQETHGRGKRSAC